MPNWKDIEVFGAAPAAPSQPSVNAPTPRQAPPSHVEPASDLLSQVKVRTDLRFYKELPDEITLSDVLQVVSPEQFDLYEIEGFYIGSREAWDLLTKYADEVGCSEVTDEIEHFRGPGYYTFGFLDDDHAGAWYNVNNCADEQNCILESVRRADEEAAERPYRPGR